jgi:prepilin-type N-terminal cleavage/methylation domain-containing protein/prepilin-type processing-associated H-X9-DG protein
MTNCCTPRMPRAQTASCGSHTRLVRRRATKLGFTLVELLVVIAIIGILVALLLPAIQAAREAARRAQCTNNLKQLGIGLQNYHDTNNKLPAGSFYSRKLPNGDQDPSGTWMLHVLPYLEEQAIFDQYNFEETITTAHNRELVRRLILPGLICPSDEKSREPLLTVIRSDPGNPPGSMGLWYPACMGPTYPDLCPFSSPADYEITCLGCNLGTIGMNGKPNSNCRTGYVFGRDEDPCAGMICRSHLGVAFRKVTDGLSQTILAGETLPAHSAYACPWCNNFPVAGTQIPINTMDSDQHLTDAQRRNGDGDQWNISGYKSMHPGGVNVVMGDGSVTFLSEAMDYVLYNVMGSKSAGDMATGI